MQYPVTSCCFSPWLFPSHLNELKKTKNQTNFIQPVKTRFFLKTLCQSKVLLLFYKKKSDFISLELMAGLISPRKTWIMLSVHCQIGMGIWKFRAPSCGTCPGQGTAEVWCCSCREQEESSVLSIPRFQAREEELIPSAPSKAQIWELFWEWDESHFIFLG